MGVGAPRAGPGYEHSDAEVEVAVPGEVAMNEKTPRDVMQQWPIRAARVRRSQARTDVGGMTRPPRDPDERAFLKRTGQEGPFREESHRRRPKP